jgi:Svf1-like C-terminal lipocalin-like domain/CrtC N-terminal lipocalin domain
VVTWLTKPLLQRTNPLTPALRLVITRPDGKELIQAPLFPPGDFHASKEECNVQMSPNWVRGDLHRYELHVEAGDLSADLVFTGIAPPWRPGSGIDYFDEARTRYFGWFPSIPFGRAEGTLVYDGQKHQVTGTGYHDHNWGNLDLNLGLSQWYWGRAHLGDYSTIFIEMEATKKYGMERLPVFMLARNDEILIEDGRYLSLQVGDLVTHESGKSYPREVDFHWENEGQSVHLAIRKPTIIEATSLLTYLPAWKRVIGRLFANPYYFRFEGDLELTVNLSGAQSKEHGQALFELMILH